MGNEEFDEIMSLERGHQAGVHAALLWAWADLLTTQKALADRARTHGGTGAPEWKAGLPFGTPTYGDQHLAAPLPLR